MKKYKNSIALRVDVSHKIGIGHLKRLINFLEYLKINKNKIFWIIKGDKVITFKILRKKYKNIYFFKNEYSPKIIHILNKKKIDTIIFDIGHKENIFNNTLQKKINFFKKKGIRTISFNHPDKKTKSDISINPYLFKNKKKINKNVELSGYKYFIFPKQFRNILKKTKKIKDSPKNILVNLGGTDPKNVVSLITKILISLNFKINIKILTAFNNKGKNTRFSKRKNIKFIEYKDQIYEYLNWADLVIINEGNIKFEVAVLGIPGIMINTVESDNSKLIKDFIKFNTVKYIPYKKIQKNFSNILSEYIKNKKLRRLHSYNGRKYFDLRGPKRIIDQINR
jgi:UDP-2,4-diacetamido-2,4,6-trideoxy-beta-L-altropyranose hydrolase